MPPFLIHLYVEYPNVRRPTTLHPYPAVIPAHAGIHFRCVPKSKVDSRLRGNDAAERVSCGRATHRITPSPLPAPTPP